MDFPAESQPNTMTDLERKLTWWLCFTLRLFLQMVIRNALIPRRWMGTGTFPNLVYSSIATWPVVYLQGRLSRDEALGPPGAFLLYVLPPVLIVMAFGDCMEDTCWAGYLGASDS